MVYHYANSYIVLRIFSEINGKHASGHIDDPFPQLQWQAGELFFLVCPAAGKSAAILLMMNKNKNTCNEGGATLFHDGHYKNHNCRGRQRRGIWHCGLFAWPNAPQARCRSRDWLCHARGDPDR